MKTHARERLFGEAAVAIGYDFGFFEDADTRTDYSITARKMRPEEGGNIRTWETQLKATTREQIDNVSTDTTGEDNEAETFYPHSEAMDTLPDVHPRQEQTLSGRLVPTERTELARLNEDQRRAHDIVEERQSRRQGRPAQNAVTRGRWNRKNGQMRHYRSSCSRYRCLHPPLLGSPTH